MEDFGRFQKGLNTLWIALTSLIFLNSLQSLWTSSSSRATLRDMHYPSHCQLLSPSAFRGFFQGLIPRTQTFALNRFVYSWSKVPRWRTTGSVGNLRLVNMIILDLVLIKWAAYKGITGRISCANENNASRDRCTAHSIACTVLRP